MKTTIHAIAALVFVNVATKLIVNNYHKRQIQPGQAPNTSINNADGDDDPFWNFSLLSQEDRKEFTKAAITMTELWTDQNLQAQVDRYSMLSWHGQKNKDTAKVHQRRLREIPSSQRGRNPFPDVANKWETEANGMEDEFMQYFLEQHHDKYKKSKQQDIERVKFEPKVQSMKRTVVERSDNYNHKYPSIKPQRMIQSTPSNAIDLNCTDPDASPNEIPCPPENLPQKCDKYNKGDFASCFALCNISFCCIHDSNMKLYKSCSKDSNCRHYSPCYIIWWKLQDTIGPMIIRTEQTDDFFNMPLKDIKDATSDGGTKPFFNQIFLHHFDDDGFISDDRARDPYYW